MEPLAPGSVTAHSVMGARLLARLQMNQTEKLTWVKGVAGLLQSRPGSPRGQTAELAQLGQQGLASKKFVCEISLQQATCQAHQSWVFPRQQTLQIILSQRL